MRIADLKEAPVIKETSPIEQVEAIYFSLLQNLYALRAIKANREQAIVITELEKVVAYYKMYVLGDI